MRRRPQVMSPWSALAAATGVQTAVACTEQGVPTLAPFFKHDLALSATVVGLLVSSLNAGKIAGSYAAGRTADRLGELPTLLGGAAATGALVLAAAVAPSRLLPVVLAAAGLFAATATPAAGRLVLSRFPIGRRGLAMGIRQAGIPIGGIVAAVVLPQVAEAGGWRPALATAGGATVVGTLAVGLATRRRLGAAQHDTATAPSHDQLRLLSDPDLRRLIVWGCILVGGQYTILTFLALDANVGSGVRLVSAVALVAVAQAGGIVGRLLWGAWSDRAFGGRRKPVILGVTVLGLAAAATLALLPRPAPLSAFVVATLVAGLSLVGWQGVWVTAVAELAGAARVGAATGFGLTFVAVAIAVSPPLYGAIVDASSFRAMWAVLTVALAAALVVAAGYTEREHA